MAKRPPTLDRTDELLRDAAGWADDDRRAHVAILLVQAICGELAELREVITASGDVLVRTIERRGCQLRPAGAPELNFEPNTFAEADLKRPQPFRAEP